MTRGPYVTSKRYCENRADLEPNDKLKEAAYQNGLIMVYLKNTLIPLIWPLPLATDFGPLAFTYADPDNFLQISWTSGQSTGDCALKLTFYDDSYLYRYVLIPAPSATPKSKLAPSSALTDLEKARAWYGLNDLSYASVKQRFGLKD